jgi:5-(carboxyamino)imidazole ribonucleotide mutase
MTTPEQPLVGVVMGSRSDWAGTMEFAAGVLGELGVACETRVVSAHRTPDLLAAYAKEAEGRGIRVIIAGAGGAAHLPGMLAAHTHLPVLGVPVQSKALNGMDSLLSIAQMPAGIPVGTLAIGKAGAVNAGLLAASILALGDTGLRGRLVAYRAPQTQRVRGDPDPRVCGGGGEGTEALRHEGTKVRRDGEKESRSRDGAGQCVVSCSPRRGVCQLPRAQPVDCG